MCVHASYGDVELAQISLRSEALKVPAHPMPEFRLSASVRNFLLENCAALNILLSDISHDAWETAALHAELTATDCLQHHVGPSALEESTVA